MRMDPPVSEPRAPGHRPAPPHPAGSGLALLTALVLLAALLLIRLLLRAQRLPTLLLIRLVHRPLGLPALLLLILIELHRLAAAGMGALAETFAPQGYNVGWNLGRIAGAGVVDHVHLHVVPRWAGDTNFMPVLADTKVLPEHLQETRRKLAGVWPS